MKAIDKQSGCLVEVLRIENDPDVEIKVDGSVNYRKLHELEFREASFSLNDTVVVTLTHEGAYHLNKKGYKRKDGKRWKTGDDYITLLWRLLPTFTKYLVPGGEAPFKNIRAL